jgi:hypothetical protein
MTPVSDDSGQLIRSLTPAGDAYVLGSLSVSCDPAVRAAVAAAVRACLRKHPEYEFRPERAAGRDPS